MRDEGGTRRDANGNSVPDPTPNVLALSEASHRRQDDLREVNDRRLDEGIRHLEVVAKLRAEHANDLRELESSRLNAIRQVDVLAVNTAADRASAAIQALAATTSANAETLRAMVANTAATIATQTTATVSAITERLAALEKSSYEGKGKQAVADPQTAMLIAAVDRLTQAGAAGAGERRGISGSWLVLLGVVSFMGGIIGIAGAAYALLKP